MITVPSVQHLYSPLPSQILFVTADIESCKKTFMIGQSGEVANLVCVAEEEAMSNGMRYGVQCM